MDRNIQLKKGLPAIGPNQVSVPEQYYKVILDSYPKPRCIAILINNKSGNQPLQAYVTTVDSIENLTGINFFPWLPDEVETKIEGRVKIELWKW